MHSAFEKHVCDASACLSFFLNRMHFSPCEHNVRVSGTAGMDSRLLRCLCLPARVFVALPKACCPFDFLFEHVPVIVQAHSWGAKIKAAGFGK